MNLKYEDNKGRIVTVVKVNGNIAELNNGERVALERLQDRNFYKALGGTSVIESSSVPTKINENMSNINQESRYHKLVMGGSVGIGDDGGNVPLSGPMNSPTNVAQIQMNGVIESHHDNLRSLGKEVPEQKNPYDSYNTNNTIVSTTEEDLLAKYGHSIQTPKTNSKLEELLIDDPKIPSSTKEERESRRSQRNNNPVPEPLVEENPVYQMFDKAKKVHSLEVSLKLNEKIPSKEVIKMLEENFDGVSAIEYYAKDIYKKLMDNPSIIENQVKEAIEKYMRSRTPKSTIKKK